MKLKRAGPTAELDRYIGYWKPTRPATRRSTPIRRSRRKSATLPAPCCARYRSSARGRLVDAGAGLEQVQQK
jgi:hypothetical protein